MARLSTFLTCPVVALLAIASPLHADPAAVEKKIHALLDQDKIFASLPGADFLSLGVGFELPDGGKQVTALALAAPGGAFDPRDLEKFPAATLGYEAKWCVERFKFYNMDWDITGLRLTSLDPEAKKYPWLVIMNGGAANVYEFYVDLKSQPGWGQFLAQKLNVMIVSIPGNFKYGGWKEPIESNDRQPAYLLNQDLPMAENNVRHAIYTNRLIMHGLEQLMMKHTTGDLFMIGHSTSGELAFLSYEYPALAARLKGRFLGWGSGGPARVHAIRAVKEPEKGRGYGGERKPPALHELNRRSASGYSGGYSRWLNPLYVAGDSTYQIAEKWMAAEGVRRPMFKQPLQDLEHSAAGWSRIGDVTRQIEVLLAEAGNPWGVNIDEVQKDLFSTAYTRMDGFNQMVWCVAHYDRNHWVPETPMDSWEVFLAKEFRLKNPDAKVRIIVWDLPMTHYGHVEKPQQLAAAFYSVVRWYK
ncbi:hypothetical protein Verru16b_02801 [Lacunisphaera limnophila]|uniref:Alpha/beta hydrolase family protein n=1 Tax=Lacunisphaera limnophila TaxID=1838286 RepID=A0A1D8AXW4_9BACT|nr:hypothetical protein [Lacunisphaera limnophila]AOS45714.1 hypothetical protein Verru16b_02801 [Lacunisphaera limnophila]